MRRELPTIAKAELFNAGDIGYIAYHIYDEKRKQNFKYEFKKLR